MTHTYHLKGQVFFTFDISGWQTCVCLVCRADHVRGGGSGSTGLVLLEGGTLWSWASYLFERMLPEDSPVGPPPDSPMPSERSLFQIGLWQELGRGGIIWQLLSGNYWNALQFGTETIYPVAQARILIMIFYPLFSAIASNLICRHCHFYLQNTPESLPRLTSFLANHLPCHRQLFPATAS